MKNFLIFISFIFLFKSGFSQKHIIGTYKSYFGESIKINLDKTFYFRSSFDLSFSWSQGKWRISNDTIYLKTEIIKDTLQVKDHQNRTLKDTLVASQDGLVNRISNNEFIIGKLSSGGQNRVKPPDKVFFKNNKLFLINEFSEIDDRKLKQFWSNKKYRTYFKKVRSVPNNPTTN
jgi:hypothetical protein